MGVAQCLLFGDSFGERTLMRRATRLRPGTQLTFDRDIVDFRPSGNANVDVRNQ